MAWQGIADDEDRIASWVLDRFGASSLNNTRERADRLLEEAIEMQQAVYAAAGCYPEVAIARANALVQHVNAKPPGNPRQEMGGVMTCALALGRRLGVRLDHAAQAELTRIEGLSKAHFDRRHQAKVDAGVAAQHDRSVPETVEICEGQYYRNTLGHKVGPMFHIKGGGTDVWYAKGRPGDWSTDGKFLHGFSANHPNALDDNLVAEWRD